jgi:hypothetical protein
MEFELNRKNDKCQDGFLETGAIYRHKCSGKLAVLYISDTCELSEKDGFYNIGGVDSLHWAGTPCAGVEKYWEKLKPGDTITVVG